MSRACPGPRRYGPTLALLTLLLALAGVGVAGAQDERRAGLVVRYGDGQVATACVRFSEPELTGVELLERSGLPVVTASDAMGGAVCKIGPDGCNFPAEGCFCRREGASYIYWAFYTLDGDAWAYASLGASSVRARDGDVHGWAWGLGDSGSGAAPPVIGLEAICGPEATPEPTTVAPAPAAAPTAAPAAATAATAGVAPTTALAATPAPAPAGQGGSLWGYAGFGALVLILGAGAVIMARRR